MVAHLCPADPVGDEGLVHVLGGRRHGRGPSLTLGGAGNTTKTEVLDASLSLNPAFAEAEGRRKGWRRGQSLKGQTDGNVAARLEVTSVWAACSMFCCFWRTAFMRSKNSALSSEILPRRGNRHETDGDDGVSSP